MTKRTKLSVKGVWIIASLSAVILPVFLPSEFGRVGPIEVGYLSMFFLSFPSSALAISILIVLDSILAFPMSRLSIMYTATVLYFVVGVLQWFWLVPKLFGSKATLQPLELFETTASQYLPGSRNSNLDIDEVTPLERVLRDD